MRLVLGISLLLISLTIIGLTFAPVAKHEFSYQIRQISNKPQEKITPAFPDFGIVIPKLNINAKVVKNVDPFDEKIYQVALTKGVAHALGTSLPGEESNIFIFSHSSEDFFQAFQYNSIFYLLTKLDIGDKITLYYQNTQFDYKVVDKKIVDPKEISYLKQNDNKKTLTLMTCYPPGTNFKRFVIIAK